MAYKIIVVLTDTDISVLQVGDEGMRLMSFKGNQSMPIYSLEDLDEFVEHCYDEYNINSFNETSFNVYIINAGGNKESYMGLINRFKQCEVLNAVDIKAVLPIVVSLKGLMKKLKKIVVSFMASNYLLSINSYGVIDIIESESESDFTIKIQDLEVLHNVKSIQNGNENEIEHIKKEYEQKIIECREEADKKINDIQQKSINTINKLHEENKKYEEAYNIVEKMNKQKQEKRDVIVADYHPLNNDQMYFVPSVIPMFDGKIDDIQKAIRCLRDGIDVKAGQVIGYINKEYDYKDYPMWSSRKYSKSIYVKAVKDGKLFIFKRFYNNGNIFPIFNNTLALGPQYYDYRDKNITEIPIDEEFEDRTIRDFFTSSSISEHQVTSNEIIAVYANDGDTRETAIEWYNKTYGCNEL